VEMLEGKDLIFDQGYFYRVAGGVGLCEG